MREINLCYSNTFKVKVPLEEGGEKVEVVNLDEDTRIIPGKINDLICDSPRTIAKWGYAALQASSLVRELEVKEKRIAAERDLFYREQAAKEGAKTTEAGLKAQVLTDPAYQEVCRQLEEARFNAEALSVIQYAYRNQAEMLVQLSKNLQAIGDPAVTRVPQVPMTTLKPSGDEPFSVRPASEQPLRAVPPEVPRPKSPQRGVVSTGQFFPKAKIVLLPTFPKPPKV